MGLTMTVDGLSAAVGDLVEVNPGDKRAAGRGRRRRPRPADLHAAGHPLRRPRRRARCAPPGCRCRSRSARRCCGRVLDGLGRPVDGGPPLGSRVSYVDLASETPHVLSRTRVDQPLTFGVRALDTLVPCGKGQRLGIFAGSGVGKSSLLAHDHPRHRRRRPRHRPDRRAWPRGARVPRGRPRPRGHGAHRRRRRHLRRAAAGAAARRRSSPPASPRPSATRAATCCCSWTRITRTAMAQREVGLSAGEPPGHPRLPAERLRDDAAAAGEGRYRRHRVDHRPLHGAGRGRRPQRADRRHRPLDPRRPHRADPQAGDRRPLPDHRRAGVDLPRGRAPSCRRSRWPTPARCAG